MSLITCSECGTEVSTSAKACPKCGASAKTLRQPQGKKGLGLPTKLGLGFAGLVIIGSAIQNRNGPPQQPKADTPEEIADKHRGKVAYDAVIALKSALREPDSAQFDQILVDDAGTLVCITYRGRNGFGGVSREHSVFIDGSPAKRSAWNKRCAGVTLNDYTGVGRIARWLGP